MRYGRLFIALAFLGTLSACSSKKEKVPQGTPITEEFLNKYNGKFEDKQSGAQIEFLPNGHVRFRAVEQVGRTGSLIPPNTICTYVLEGEIRAVLKRNALRRSAYLEYADTLIQITPTKVNLDLSAGSRQDTLENCQKFESDLQRFNAYSLFAEIIDDNQIRFHHSGNESLKTKTRTEANLDEVFVRAQ